jgi:hypothetical protein
MTDKISWDRFLGLKEVKHATEIDVDDILWLDDGKGFRPEEKTFIKVVCTGYCGKDEFYGRTEDGKPIGFCDGDVYKIVSKQIKVDGILNSL